MTNRRVTLAILAIATIGASSVHAGGADNTLMPTEMMYQKGGYADVSVARIGRDVTGTNVAPTGSMYPDYTSTTVAIKADIGEKISIGFADYLSAAILVDYKNSGASGAYAGFANAMVDLKIKSRLLAAKYQVNENISVMGGVKYSSTSDATANVLKNPYGNLTIPSANGVAYAAELAYEIPEIALRVTALYQSATKFDLPMTSNYYPTSGILDGKAGLPQSATIRFQSGVAKDTLVFGSYHLADWGNAQVEFDTDKAPKAVNDPAGVVLARSTFTKGTAYTLGVGRKLSEEYAVSATYGSEPAGAATGSSLLSTTNGKKSLSLGFKYTSGPTSVSVGYSHIKLGDFTSTGSDADGAGTTFQNSVFSGNSASVIGLKVGYSF
jgi:hypothetical protein